MLLPDGQLLGVKLLVELSHLSSQLDEFFLGTRRKGEDRFVAGLCCLGIEFAVDLLKAINKQSTDMVETLAYLLVDGLKRSTNVVEEFVLELKQ